MIDDNSVGAGITRCGVDNDGTLEVFTVVSTDSCSGSTDIVGRYCSLVETEELSISVADAIAEGAEVDAILERDFGSRVLAASVSVAFFLPAGPAILALS